MLQTPAPASQPLHRNPIVVMVLILLLASVLRLAAFGKVPPGLYHDEAYNGLDALRVLDGDTPLYFGANNGREPMFIYLIALSVGLLGRSPFALRLAAFAPGLLTVAATYALARTLFTRRVGLLSAAVLSMTLWHVHLSRVGFRAVLLPLFITLTLWQGALGWRTGRRRYWVAAGSLYGLSFYTYNAARFTPAAVLFFALYCLLTRPDWRTRERLVPLAWAGLAVLVTLAPLAVFTLLHPDLVIGRAGQVSVWNPGVHGGDFWGTLGRHAARTLGMFFVKGDRIWRHNVPRRPVFDPLLGVVFVLGLTRALRRFRREPAMALLVIGSATMTLPTLLAEDAPHFLRGVGVLPLAVVFPALGLDWLLRIPHPASRIQRRVAFLSILAILSAGLIGAVTAYFGNYARAEMTAYWFEDGGEALAGEINRFLGVGWDGERMLPPSGVAEPRPASGDRSYPPSRQVYVEPLLWDTWTALPFLVSDASSVRLLPPDREWPAVGVAPTAIFVWPYGDWKRVWSMVNGPADIRVQEGVLSQDDRDPAPYTTYRAFYITPVEAVPQALFRFRDGVELVGAKARSTAQGLYVELLWHATAPLSDDYTVFVHYMRDEQRIAQGDAQPAEGHYPTSRWQAGDLIHDDHAFSLPGPPDLARDQIILGFYDPRDDRRLDVLDQAGNLAGTSVALPINEILP